MGRGGGLGIRQKAREKPHAKETPKNPQGYPSEDPNQSIVEIVLELAMYYNLCRFLILKIIKMLKQLMKHTMLLILPSQCRIMCNKKKIT